VNDTIAPNARRALLQPNADRWLEAVPLAMLGVDSGLRIRMVNAAAADLLGAAGRGLLGRRLADVFGPDAPITDLCRRCLTQEMRLTEGDVLVEGPGFSLGRADLWASPLEGQEFISVVVVPRTRARAAGETTRPMSAVAKTLAHEVRNPLAGIRGAAQLIRKSTEAEEIEPLAGLIIDEVDRIRRLTDRIGALDGLAAPKFAPVNVHEALERVRKIISSSFPDVLIKERYDPSLPSVRADFDQLIQAFLNIAKNAEAVRLRSDGEISLSTAYRPGLRIRSALGGAARAQLEVQIEDNGPGVSEATQARLFEPFVTTKMGGMGLGLAVSAEIVSRHGGRIECDSMPGRTIFRLLLPIDRQEDAT
jgi:two-component system nitrogen regulation sensor histidine kinase GlnL